VNPEITSSAVRTATDEPEPTLTISQLQSLLRAAAELERASRPIYLQPAAQPATAPHPGADIRVPSPAAPNATFTVDRPRNIFPLLFMVSGCTGLGSGTAAVATGNEGAIAVTIAAIVAWGVATYQLVFCRES
jgi:hypothetical protein